MDTSEAKDNLCHSSLGQARASTVTVPSGSAICYRAGEVGTVSMSMSRSARYDIRRVHAGCIGLGSVVFSANAVFGRDVLWDNGDTDGAGAVVHSTDPDHSALDDFVVPVDEAWCLAGFGTLGLWNTLPPGAGEGIELTIWSHVEDHPEFPGYAGPDQPVASLAVNSYMERATGRTWIARPETAIWVECEPYELGAGKYWIEMHVLGPESFGQMERTEILGNPYWVNWDDADGLRPVLLAFGFERDLSWSLRGTVVGARCPEDLDGSGAVDFADLLAVVGAWGPCPHHSGCIEDLDDSGVVDFSDLLMLLAAWGPCA